MKEKEILSSAPILTLPEMVVFQAIKDLKSKNPKVARSAYFWLLDGGGLWQSLTKLDIRELLFQACQGKLDRSKIYKGTVKNGSIRAKKTGYRKF